MRALGALALVALAGCGSGPPCGVHTQCVGLQEILQCKGSRTETISCPDNGFCIASADGKTVGCQAPFVVNGSLRYADRAQTDAGLGDPVLLTLPNASVSVVGDDGVVLGTGYADGNGKYSVTYGSRTSTAVHVLVAAKSDPTVLPLSVNGEKGLQGFGSPNFTAEATHVVDVDIDEPVAAASFNLLTVIGGGMRSAQQWSGVARLVPLTVVYFVSSPGSYYTPVQHVIHVGGATTDSDGYDDAVVLHETGHYVEDTISLTDSEGGRHDGRPASPNLAWSEGFATWFSSAVRNDPRYMDSYSGGIYILNLDNSTHAADPLAPMSQLVSEWMDAEVMWDVIDSGPNDDDTLSFTPDKVVDVLRTGIPRTGHVDRGSAGVDFVDWLDEWFIKQGTGSCAGMKGILAARTFPYDYAAPGAACP